MKISEVVALPPLQKSNIDCEPPDLPHRFNISIRMVMAVTEHFVNQVLLGSVLYIEH